MCKIKAGGSTLISGGRGDKETKVYPQGYRGSPSDGSRCGVEGQRIVKWHDFYALVGKAVFNRHICHPPPVEGDNGIYISYILTPILHGNQLIRRHK